MGGMGRWGGGGHFGWPGGGNMGGADRPSPGGFGGTFPGMSNPGAQPQLAPVNPMTGNTTVAPGSPNPANPMMGGGGQFGMLGSLFGGGGVGSSANMNPVMNALSMAMQSKMNQGG